MADGYRTPTQWLCMCGRTRSDAQGEEVCPYCSTHTVRFSHTLGWHVRRSHRTQYYGAPPVTGWECKTCRILGSGGPGDPLPTHASGDERSVGGAP